MLKEEFVKYFENLRDAIGGIPPENILNYDETNLPDDLGMVKLIFKRGTKYLERIWITQKEQQALFFLVWLQENCCQYTFCTKQQICGIRGQEIRGHSAHDITAQKVASSTTIASTIGLEQWLCHGHWEKRDRKLLLEIIWWLTLTDILKLCEDLCLAPNSMQISQLLNVTFYGPLKEKWRKILKEWKLKNHIQTAMPKDIFPALLK